MIKHIVENSKIYYIPAKPPKRDKPVGIYYCVSTNSVDQLKNLTAQVSVLTILASYTIFSLLHLDLCTLYCLTV